MSTFKTVNTDVFIESLYRMRDYEDDPFLTLIHEGKIDTAPLTSEWVIEKVRKTKTITNNKIRIFDTINMPTESISIYGNSTISGIATPDSPKTLTVVGRYNGDTWNTVITDGSNPFTLQTIQPMCKLTEDIIDIYKDGQVVYRTEYGALNHIANWYQDEAYTNNNVLVVSLFVATIPKNSTDILCTHFTASNDHTKPNNIWIEDYRLYLSLERAKFPHLTAFLEWLEQHEVTCIWERKYPIEQVIDPSIEFMGDELGLFIDNDQNALMTVEYRIAPNARVWHKENGKFVELR